jgi:hypothetical protein
MANDRWAWLCQSRVLSIATGDAGDQRVVEATQASDPASRVLQIDTIATNGSTFMIGNTVLSGDGGALGILSTTDGIATPTPYLVSTDGSWYDFPAYAGAYLAWFRGIGWQDINFYQKVELWASPYDPDPSKLTPFKVDDYAAQSPGDLLGASGRIAAVAPEGGAPYSMTTVWDLATRTRKDYTLPSNHVISFPYMGLTSTHLWIMGAPSQGAAADMYVRFALQ